MDTSNGSLGVLQQIVPVVCCATGQPRECRLAYLNSAVKALRKLSKLSGSRKSSLKSSHRQNADAGSNGSKNDKGTISCLATTKDFSLLKEEEENASDAGLKSDFSMSENEIYLDKLKDFICMLRCCLVSEYREVRSAGLRLLRYIVNDHCDAMALYASNIVPLIVKCLDSCSVGSAQERLQALRLVRKIIQVDPGGTSQSVVAVLVSIANCGLHGKDVLVYPSLAILTELMIISPEIAIQYGSVTVLQRALLECSSVPRIHETIMASLLRLVNSSEHRSHTRHMDQVLAPFMDPHYKHTPYDLPINTNEECELRILSAKQCVLTLLRSWPGLMLLSKQNFTPLKSLTTQLAYSPYPKIQMALVDLLYELFSIRESANIFKDDQFINWREAITDHLELHSHDPSNWCLVEGFVAAEATDSLPYYSSRPNIVRGHLCLVLYSLIKANILPALCHVIINAPLHLAIRTTILLGELVHSFHQDLPTECSPADQSLPQLMNQAVAFSINEQLIPNTSNVAAENITSSCHVSNMSFCSHPNIALDGTELETLQKIDENVQLPFSGIISLPRTVDSKMALNANTKYTSNDCTARIDPYHIPINGNIINGNTSKKTCKDRVDRASVALDALQQLSRHRLQPPLLPPQHSLYLAHLMHSLPHANSGSPLPFPSSRDNQQNEAGDFLLQQVFNLICLYCSF